MFGVNEIQRVGDFCSLAKELHNQVRFWNDVEEFETNERKNESKNTLLSEARAGARMEAYVKLQELQYG